MTNPLPPGVPELSQDESIDMGRNLDPVTAAYALGAQRGYEAAIEAAAEYMDVHDFNSYAAAIRALPTPPKEQA